jgi:type II secretory pathway pseudopilin PulG
LSARGFTTLELILVLGLMGLLSSLAVGAFALLNREVREWSEPTQLLQAAVREARFQALQGKQTVELRVQAGGLEVRRGAELLAWFEIPEDWLPWAFFERQPGEGLGGNGNPRLVRLSRDALTSVRFDPSGVSTAFVLVQGEGGSRQAWVVDAVSDAYFSNWRVEF